MVSWLLLAGQLALGEGTELIVRLDQSVSSQKAQAGDSVALSVVQAVRVGECTMIAQDAVVDAMVILSKRKTRFGGDGMLDIAAERVRAADGSWVRVRHAAVKTLDVATTEKSGAATTLGLLWYSPAAAVGRLFASGQDVRIPKSSRFKVYIDEPHAVAECVRSG